MVEILKVENLYKKYNNEEVLKNVSFSLNEGETLCIIGPSGSGKSTLLRCINNLEKIDNGTVIIDDTALITDGKYSDKKIIEKINSYTGMVFQDFNLFPHMNVLENITFAQEKVLKRNKEKAKEITNNVLKKIGLKEKANVYPCNLSGGQKQRVAIARCLAMSPKILCMDEPTSALDPELVGEVLKVIKDLSNENKTMIIVTHEIAFAREIADKIIFMDNGKIIEEGRDVIDKPQNERTKEFLKRFNYSKGEDNMEKTIDDIEPQSVFKFFKDISNIPRNSSKEEKVRDYIVEFAEERNLKYYTDEYFNIILTKEAEKEFKNYDTLAFQAHLDMVCEKTKESNHNFDTDPIELIIDGDYIKGNNTTLGADNGAGVAIMLALLDSNIKTPKLECIFTVQEETTMIGAKEIDTDKITSKRIISLDCGREGKMVISSANCLEWYGKIDIEYENNINLNDYYIYELNYSNFKGGHSGGNIADKTRGNPIKLGIDILKEIESVRIIDIKSSGKVNVIPRDFSAIFAVEKNSFNIEKVEETLVRQKEIFKEEFITLNKVRNIEDYIENIITKEVSKRIIDFISSYKNGALSFDDNNNQILSANFGAVNIVDNYIRMDYSLRSNNMKLREEYLNNLEKKVEENSVEIIWSQELYGFEPNYESSLVNKVSKLYESETNTKMEKIITQGVLEGGFFNYRMKDVDYIAIGPDTYDVHSPSERMSISSMERTWDLVKSIVTIKF